MLTAEEALLKTQITKDNFKEKAKNFFVAKEEEFERLIIEATEEGKIKTDIWFMSSELENYGIKGREATDILTEYLKKELSDHGYKTQVSYNSFACSLLIVCQWGEE